MQMHAQYGSMVPRSLSVHGRQMRVPAVRQTRQAIDAAATKDAWTLHVTERSKLRVIDPDAGRREAARPAAYVDQRIEDDASENDTNSHVVAFETRMSAQPWNRGSKGSDKSGLL